MRPILFRTPSKQKKYQFVCSPQARGCYTGARLNSKVAADTAISFALSGSWSQSYVRTLIGNFYVLWDPLLGFTPLILLLLRCTIGKHLNPAIETLLLSL